MPIRQASHAGSWYKKDGPSLEEEIFDWFADIRSQETNEADNELDYPPRPYPKPIPGVRVIIAPHAGFAYSGETAAHAYKCLDVSQGKKETNIKRVFLLGPSHHYALSTCALSKHSHYCSPIGDLALGLDLIETLRGTKQFEDMSLRTDLEEHSLEMHVPFIYFMLKEQLRMRKTISLIPILVGNTSKATEQAFGKLLAPYLADPTNVFVVSSDFCHWGTRFHYTYYLPEACQHPSAGRSLRSRDKPQEPKIYESIAQLDRLAMEAIESGSHDAFRNNLKDTNNTVCGRHPIGVILAALETLRTEGKIATDKGFFKFIEYTRSSNVLDASDSSVSYASAYAVL